MRHNRTSEQFTKPLPLCLILLLFLMLPSYTMAQKLPFLSPDSDYLWPTNASRYLSATFAETRAAHFHGGVDIGTWGQRGYRVFATRGGVVSRIVISPTGFGNAIYLKHDDGSFSVYAHLKDFVPEIRTKIDSIRFRNYRFTFDEDIERFGIRFNRGDLIGLTGDTGIGPPHLHIELRTPSNNPFNPLLSGIRIPDRVPPVFHSLAIEPLSAGASVNGNRDITVVRISTDKNRYVFPEITVNGTIGLAVDASDRADNRRNVYAVYELLLKVNGELQFHARADSFLIDDAGMMRLDRVLPLLQQTRKGYQRLHIRDGNSTPFYLTPPGGGRLTLDEGSHQIEIIARDFYGNEAILEGIIRWEKESPEPSIMPFFALAGVPATPVQSPVYFMDNFIWTNDWITSLRELDHIFIQRSSFYNRTAEYFDILPAGSVIDLRERSTIKANGVNIHRVYPGESHMIASADKRFKATFHPATLYDTMSVVIHHQMNDSSPILQLFPEHEPLRNGFTIHYLLDAEQRQIPNIGLYSINNAPNGDKRYSYLVGRIDGAVLTARAGAFGRFTILSDTIGPVIESPRIFQRNDGKWIVSVLVDDDLSGVDFGRAWFEVNKVRGIAEYDPFGKRLIYHLPGFRPSKSNHIYVRLPDRAGNLTEATFEI